MKRKLTDFNIFETDILIDRIARRILKAEGYKVNTELNLTNSSNPKILLAVKCANDALDEIKIYLNE